MALLLTVDPSEAERVIQRFGVGYSWFSGVFLENTQPNSIGDAMVGRQPLAKLWGGSKGKYCAGIFHFKSSHIRAR
jgi:hypothetical protein